MSILAVVGLGLLIGALVGVTVGLTALVCAVSPRRRNSAFLDFTLHFTPPRWP